MARYLLGVNFQSGVVEAPMDEWTPEEIAAHLDYYGAIREELTASGERVQSEVLVGPDLAKIVTSDGLGAPVVTDGPFQEFKEWLAGSIRRSGRLRSPRSSPPCPGLAACRRSSRSSFGR